MAASAYVRPPGTLDDDDSEDDLLNDNPTGPTACVRCANVDYAVELLHAGSGGRGLSIDGLRAHLAAHPVTHTLTKKKKRS